MLGACKNAEPNPDGACALQSPYVRPTDPLNPDFLVHHGIWLARYEKGPVPFFPIRLWAKWSVNNFALPFTHQTEELIHSWE